MQVKIEKLLKCFNDTYRFDTYLYIGTDFQSMKKQVGKEKFWDMEDFESCIKDVGIDFAGLTYALDSPDGIQTYFIYLKSWDEFEDSVTVLSHEVGHVTHKALIKRGWSDFTNEDVFHSYLYLHDSIFNNLLRQVIKSTKNKKKGKS